jgi:hypothetical protein
MRSILFVFILFASFSVFAQTTTLNDLAKDVDTALDAVLDCKMVPPIGNPLGILLGRYIHIWTTRGQYVDGYITPLVESVKTNIFEATPDFDYRNSDEYKNFIEMTMTDENFTHCPSQTRLLILAIDEELQFLSGQPDWTVGH